MFVNYCLFGLIAMIFAMVTAKRITALIRYFTWQSFFLFLIALYSGITTHQLQLYIVAFMVLFIKVIGIPFFLNRITRKTNMSEDIGLFVNPVFSVFLALMLTYFSYLFVGKYLFIQEKEAVGLIVALAMSLIGMFLMIFRMKALAQVIGLLVMENGIFLASASIAGNMPFFIEIAISFDIFVCVVILGVFIYRINSLFTHIDVSKLTRLKG